jgi:transcriptional regulator with XRE-family HTH domain
MRDPGRCAKLCPAACRTPVIATILGKCSGVNSTGKAHGKENLMKSAGSLLKEARVRLNLRYRDVEEASHEIARRHGNDEFIIALSRLADIENKGTPPSLCRLYSLCTIYRLEILEVLSWYGIPVESMREDALLCKQNATNLLPNASAPEPPSANGNGVASDLPESQKRFIAKSVATNPVHSHLGDALLVRSVLGLTRKRPFRLGVIGDEDDAMAPILPPGSVVMIDDQRKRIARTGWKSELDRPIYFLETRDGYLCRWCSLDGDELTAIPHPSSKQAPRRLRVPSEVEVIGEVMGVTMQRPQVRQSRAR